MNVAKKTAGDRKGLIYAAGLILTGAFLFGCGSDSATGSGGNGGSVPADNTLTATIDGVTKSGVAVSAKVSGLTVITGSVYTGTDVANLSTFIVYLKDTVAGEYNLAWNSAYTNGSYAIINNLYLQKHAGDTSLYWAVGQTAGKSGTATVTIASYTSGSGITTPGKITGTFSGTLVNIKDSTDRVTVSGGFNAPRYY
jgi:hypothetical protein